MFPAILATSQSAMSNESQFLEHMKIPEAPGIFVLGCFERRVTLYSQQVRALNLVHSLFQAGREREGRLRAGSKVLVIGGGAAGLTAAAGAAVRDCQVTLLEQMGVPLPMFRDNATRWIHPHIYEWPRPGSEEPQAKLPLLDWKADLAREVAEQLLTQWELLKNRYSISAHYNVQNIRIRAQDANSPQRLVTWNASGHNEGRFDAVILAVGFGLEKTPPNAPKRFYWETDSLGDTARDPDKPRLHYLVSGIGDGGLIDLCRLCLRGFHHKEVVRKYLSSPALDSVKARLLELEEDFYANRLKETDFFRYYRELSVPLELDEQLRRDLRTDTSVVLNATSPSPLSSRASILNRFLASRLIQLNNVTYRSGSIEVAREKQDYRVTFTDGGLQETEHFYDIVIRHGPDSRLKTLLQPLLSEDDLNKLDVRMRTLADFDRAREPLFEAKDFVPPGSTLGPQAPVPQVPSSHEGNSDPELPAQDRCIGREQDLKWLVDEILAPLPRAPMLLGPAGIGKTTLSIKALHAPAVEQRFQTRRYFVRLEHATTLEQTITAFVRGLGLKPEGDPWKAVLSMLRTAPALLVLDNLETPWEGTESEAIEGLLAKLGDIPTLVLVGSIKGYRCPEQPHYRRPRRVEPLTSQVARELFCQIAYDVDPQSAAIDTLLQGQGGNPLAIKLVARMAQGVGNIENVVDLWQQEGIPDEVKTFELAITSPRVTEDARQLLQVVAWLPAGLHRLDRDAIMPRTGLRAEICLTQAALGFNEGERLQVHPAIRNYVRHRHPPSQQMKDEVRTHYYRLAQRLGPRIGFRDGEGGMARLMEEVDNLDMLIQVGLEPNSAQEAIKTVVALRDVMRFSARGHLSSLYSYFNFASQSNRKEATADCACVIGHIASGRSEHKQAWEYFQQALPLYQQVGNIRGEANCIIGLGDIALMRSLYKGAREHYLHALRLFRQVKNILGQADSIFMLGAVASDCGEHEEAQDHFQQALPLYQEVGYILGQANCIHGQGEIVLKRSPQRHQEARECFQQALLFYRETGNTLGQANCILGLGKIAFEHSRHEEEARNLFQQAFRLYEKLGDILGQANCIFRLGEVALGCQQRDEARSLFNQALSLYRLIPEPQSIGLAHYKLAQCAPIKEDRQQHVSAARRVWTNIGRKDLVDELDKEFGSSL
jgi:tetratricopeptide (TPR) repeat protein